MKMPSLLPYTLCNTGYRELTCLHVLSDLSFLYSSAWILSGYSSLSMCTTFCWKSVVVEERRGGEEEGRGEKKEREGGGVNIHLLL